MASTTPISTRDAKRGPRCPWSLASGIVIEAYEAMRNGLDDRPISRTFAGVYSLMVTRKKTVPNERAEMEHRWRASIRDIKKAPLRVLFSVICL